MYAQSKNELLSKFLDIFIQHGIENTTMRMLCQGAQINPNTVYQIFKNKEEIIINCGFYATQLIENELRLGAPNYCSDQTAMGEFFFKTFRKYKKEIRFCIQLMTSPNINFKQTEEVFEQKMFAYSNELASILGMKINGFEMYFRLFMSMMYYYCITGDEAGAKKQRQYIYGEVEKKFDSKRMADSTERSDNNF